MEIALTSMSSKGQIVIPNDLRKDFSKGEKLLVIKDKHSFIIKRASDLDKQLTNDLLFAKKTEEALKRLEKSKPAAIDFDAFINDMKQW